MLKRRVTESTLDTYAARIRPSDLVASAFHRAAALSDDADAPQRNRPEGAQQPQLLAR